MGRRNYFSHVTPDGQDPFDRSKRQGFGTFNENIAAGVSDVTGTMQQWKDSDGHCRNMMKASHTRMGAGYAYTGGSLDADVREGQRERGYELLPERGWRQAESQPKAQPEAEPQAESRRQLHRHGYKLPVVEEPRLLPAVEHLPRLHDEQLQGGVRLLQRWRRWRFGGLLGWESVLLGWGAVGLLPEWQSVPAVHAPELQALLRLLPLRLR